MKKKMKFTKDSVFLILALLIFSVVHFVHAANPGNPPSTGIDLIYAGNNTAHNPQSKAGTLLISATGTSATFGFSLDVGGSTSAEGLRLYKTAGVGGNLYSQGKIYSDTLKTGNNNTLCSNANGEVIRCP